MHAEIDISIVIAIIHRMFIPRSHKQAILSDQNKMIEFEPLCWHFTSKVRKFYIPTLKWER